jgi:UDP-N-acetylmuramate-alanine ligase
MGSACDNYYSKIFNEFFDPNNIYNIPIIGIIGSGNKTYTNKIISDFFIYVGKNVCSCDNFDYYINGNKTNLSNKSKWENIELALINNKTEVLIFSIDSDDIINEGIYCKNYNPVILGNINTDNDENYYMIQYKKNTFKLLAYFIENYEQNGFIVLNGDDPNILNFIDYCKDKKFITEAKFIFYTVKHPREIKNNENIMAHSFVYVENNNIYLKNYMGTKKLVQIPIGFNIELLVSIIASIWSIYDIYMEDKKKILVEFISTI